MRKFLLLCLAVAISGCATPLRNDQIRATIDSYPAGAIISIKGPQNLSGQAPQEWSWTTEQGKQGGYVIATARWVSGATITQRLQIENGQHRKFTLYRPDAPGVEADIQWAIALQQKEAADKQASQAVFAEALRSYNENRTIQNRQPSQPRQSLDCTSTKTGNITNTSCY